MFFSQKIQIFSKLDVFQDFFISKKKFWKNSVTYIDPKFAQESKDHT